MLFHSFLRSSPSHGPRTRVARDARRALGKRAKTHRLSLELLEERNLLSPTQFDFGTTTSPVAAGYTQVTPATTYSAAQGYGWQNGVIQADDRVTGTDLTRDFNFTTLGTFAVDLPNGTYTVTLTLGDVGAFPHDQMQISLEGGVVDTVSTAAGQILTKSYSATVSDGQLNL